MKYGIVGCGRIYQNHVRAAQLVDDIELVGLADSDETRLADAIAQTGLPGFVDYHDLIDAGAEAIGLCLPHSSHAEVCIDLAQRGVHVLSEKPLSTSLPESDRMIEACEAADVRLGVVFQHRFNENSRILKALIDNGDLGELVLGTAIFQYHKEAKDAAYFEWRGSIREAGGGVLANFGVHTVDLLLWLMGPAKDARGFIGTLAMGTEIEDTAVAAVQFENGAMGTVAATLASSVNFESRLCVAGIKGTAVLTDSSTLVVQHVDGRSAAYRFDGLLNDKAYPTKAPYGRGHIDVLRDFAEAVRDRRAPACDGHSARRTQQVITTIYEQANDPGRQRASAR